MAAVEAWAGGTGLALAGAGLAWSAWAAWTRQRQARAQALAWSSHPQGAAALLPRPTGPGLVEDGPYRFGRNPGWLGLLMLGTGLSLAGGGGFVLLATGAAALWLDRVHLPRQEARLQARYGGWYSDYRAQVRRWV
jgi:protein-S-isoprenylcysteine O-methyltransferase Ste14